MKPIKLIAILVVVLLGAVSRMFAQNYYGHYLKQIKTSVNPSGIGEVKFMCAAYDKRGNLYAAGYFRDSVIFDNGTIMISMRNNNNEPTNDVVIAKFDRNGHTIWAKRGGSTDIDNANNIAIDADNNVYVTGWCGNNHAVFGTITLNNAIHGSGGGYGGYIAKLDSNGNYTWVKDGIMITETALYVDKSNNVYFGGGYGFTTNADNPPQYSGLIFPEVFNDRYYILKMDGNGNILDRFFPPENGIASIQEITGDAQGNIIVVGDYYSSGFAADSGVQILNAKGIYSTPGANSAFLLKLDTHLKYIWAKPAWSSASNGYTGAAYTAVTTDSLNNIYVGGFFGDTVTLGNLTFTQQAYRSLLYAKYDKNGLFQWAKIGSNAGSGNDFGFQRLAYDKTSNKVWASIRNGHTPIRGHISITVSGITDTSFLMIANINQTTGSFSTLVHCPSTSTDISGGGLAVWNQNVALAGGYYPYYSNDTDLLMAGLRLPMPDGAPVNGYVFGMSDSNTMSIGINKLAVFNNTFSISPNPSGNHIAVALEGDKNANGILSIIDITGKEIYCLKLTDSTTTIDVSVLKAGVYNIIVNDGKGECKRKRLIIAR